RLYRNSVQKLIEAKAVLRREEFFTLVNAIVQATVEFKKICGRSHGNIKATNVLLAKPGKSALNEVVLADAAPGDTSKSAECELADLRGIGEIIHRLVINEDREEEYWTIPPPPTLQEWVSVFGKDGEAWHNLCARLLEPDLSLRNYNLGELVFDLKRLQQKPKISQKLLVASAVGILLLGVAGVFAIKRFGSGHSEVNADAEMRQKQAIDQAARLSKEKRSAEERAESEAEARRVAQQKMESNAKRLAEEKRLIEERAAREAKAGEEARRQSVTASQQKIEEQERMLKASEERRLAEEAKAQQLAAASPQKPVETTSVVESTPESALPKATLGREWFNTLGMRLIPLPDSKILICAWETRRKDYEQFVKLSEQRGDLSWRATTFKQGNSEPVVNVAPGEAVTFCNWLTQYERKQGLISKTQAYRLPTDAEWTRACDVASASAFAWGNTLPPPTGTGNFAQWCSYDRFPFTAPVAGFQPNALGIHDLAGNVWEICRDGSTYVARGGSWQTELPEQLQVLFRLRVLSGERKQDVGFRCVLDFASVD
ncbi:MAG: serine/threonine protein kinase, partial [Verrucomicrobiales bacterium]|nr:serine/threonine protein kinase [Verrucomicrobiales bacterium]